MVLSISTNREPLVLKKNYRYLGLPLKCRPPFGGKQDYFVDLNSPFFCSSG
jgi:hypothetical protein